jgi:hypothetical protein
MTVSNRLDDYLTLLKIRQAGRRRSASILGGLFFISLLASLALGLLDQITGRSVFIIAAVLVAIGSGALMARVRLEIVSDSLELVDALRRAFDDNAPNKI